MLLFFIFVNINRKYFLKNNTRPQNNISEGGLDLLFIEKPFI